MVADLLPPERHEAGYASTRVASNLGVVFGPAIGGLLLIGGHWSVLFFGVTVMGAVAIALAYRYLPHRGAYAPTEPPTRGSFPVIRRDTVFLVFLLSSALAYFVYIAYETVLPVSAVKVHGLSPSTWGFIVIVNPRAGHALPAPDHPLGIRLPARRQVRHRDADDGRLVPAPAARRLDLDVPGRDGHLRRRRDALGADLAGDRSGARAGGPPRCVHGRVQLARASLGFALGPFIGLQLLDITEPDTGDGSAWYFFAGVSVAAAIAGAAAVRGASTPPAARRSRPREAPRRDSPARRHGRVPRLGADARATSRCASAGETHELADEGDGVFARTLRAAPGDDYIFVLDGVASCPDPCSRFQPEGIRGPSRVVEIPPAARRGLSLDELVIYELHVGAVLRGGDLRRRDPAPRRSPRARRDGDRADAGRDVPGGARLGLRRRLQLRAAPGVRRAGRADPPRRRRTPRGARRDHGRRLQPHRAGQRGGDGVRRRT